MIGDYLATQGRWPFDIAQTTKDIYNHVYRKTSQNVISPDNTKMISQVLSAILNLYQKGGIKFFDVSPGNIGKDNNGNFMIFDLGISFSKKTALPVVEMLLGDWVLPIV